MSLIEIYQIDAFTDKVFYGNPAAVCLLDEWLNDELMQAIAVENNLSETAFVIQNQEGFHIRWFTPRCEIELCGHATLAAAYALFETGRSEEAVIHFHSLGGDLTVSAAKDVVTLDFPAFDVHPSQDDEKIQSLLNQEALSIAESELDYLVELADEAAVAKALVDLDTLALMPKRGLILTARADHDMYEVYSRCFYPKHHIPEDPVTGSAHCVLAPYWCNKLGRQSFSACQGSVRKGMLSCELDTDRKRVYISGSCRWYLKGQLVI